MDITRLNSASLATSRSSEPRAAFIPRPRIVLAWLEDGSHAMSKLLYSE